MNMDKHAHEDRLARALAARADLVQPESLQPAAAPVSRGTESRGMASFSPRGWRRTSVLAAGIAAAIVVAAAVIGVPGREQTEPAPQLPRDTVPNKLDLTVVGGSSVRLPAPVAGCVDSESDPGSRVLYVLAGKLGGPPVPAFYLRVPEAELDPPMNVELPWDVRTDDGASSDDHAVFAGTRDVEASSSQRGAAGTVELLAASCEVGAEIRLRVDVRLGSEMDDGEIIRIIGGVNTEAVDLETLLNG